jgi:hypothetical protein
MLINALIAIALYYGMLVRKECTGSALPVGKKCPHSLAPYCGVRPL